MSKPLNNNTLPIEILKKIFQNLLIANSPEKKDLKTCSSVCKSWKVAAQEIFGKMSIKVNEHSLEKLSKDIVYFGQKVKSIELMEKNLLADVDRTVTRLVWLDIILACPNLASIKISAKDDSNYVQCLMDIPTERLAHIQSFETPTPDLHLQLTLKYCKSITSLSIISDSVRNIPGSDRNNTLIYFISQFPKLTFIHLKDLYLHRVVDLMQFLEAAPQLQELFIHHFDEVKSSSKTISNNSCLSVLRLTVSKMDTNSLILITTRLKKLNKLRLRINDLIKGEPQNTFGIRNNYSAEELLADLKNYTSGISELFIKYEYEDETYKLGKEPEIFENEDFDDGDNDDSDDSAYYDSDYDESGPYNGSDFYYDNDEYSDNWHKEGSDYFIDNDYYDDRSYDDYSDCGGN